MKNRINGELLKKDQQIRVQAKKIRTLESSIDPQVVFSAVRKSYSGFNHVKPGQVIRFTEMVANVGRGMNARTGTFTVPVSGLYSFSISALSALYHKDTYIGLYKNGQYQFQMGDQNMNYQRNFDNISYNWMMFLVKNDQIYLKMYRTSGLYVDSDDYVWFNGQLVKAR